MTLEELVQVCEELKLDLDDQVAAVAQAILTCVRVGAPIAPHTAKVLKERWPDDFDVLTRSGFFVMDPDRWDGFPIRDSGQGEMSLL